MEKFCLQWASRHDTITGIRDFTQFFDCTLATEDDESSSDNLRAHRVILSACSEFFRKILTKESVSAHPNPLIYLRGISAQDMSNALDFMYHGEICVAREELDRFLEVAEALKLKGLTRVSNSSRANKRRSPSPISSPPSLGDPSKKPEIKALLDTGNKGRQIETDTGSRMKIPILKLGQKCLSEPDTDPKNDGYPEPASRCSKSLLPNIHPTEAPSPPNADTEAKVSVKSESTHSDNATTDKMEVEDSDKNEDEYESFDDESREV